MATDSVIASLQAALSEIEDERAVMQARFDLAADGIKTTLNALVGKDSAATLPKQEVRIGPAQQHKAQENDREFLRILHANGEPMRQRDIVRRHSGLSTAGAAYHSEKRLAGVGLVARFGKDGRNPIVGLTTKGRALAERAFAEGEEPDESQKSTQPQAAEADSSGTRKRAQRRSRFAPKTPRSQQKTRAETERAILEYVADNDRAREIRVKQALEEQGYHESSVRRAFKRLEARGSLHRYQMGPRHVEYSLRGPQPERPVTIRPGEPLDYASRQQTSPANPSPSERADWR